MLDEEDAWTAPFFDADEDTVDSGLPAGKRLACVYPMHEHLMDAVFDVAEFTADDYVIDCGSADGRVVLSAAQRFPLRACVGIDIDARQIQLSQDKAVAMGMSDKVEFLVGDLFESRELLTKATVLILYMTPTGFQSFSPFLWEVLGQRPDIRIVSACFSLGEGWKLAPELVREVRVKDTMMPVLLYRGQKRQE
eukprot:GILI01079278.1.p1 GENE.GILI01079278.1~~GILI01079278.1.p1  ORF type:complete len:212 (-),score=54.87 GILI01079278.1:9-590(-)